MTFHPRITTAPLTALVLAILVVLAPGTVAAADDGTVAWSLAPAAADGTVDGRTRLELQLAPGASTVDHVVISNASTTDQTFAVYGADAFNTSDGGYDLLSADKTSTDAGSWVTVDHPQVTIPALKTALVAVTVAAPAGATPGDHSAGIVVSRAVPKAGAQGVVLDTRVAVRLSVRIAGALSPVLKVQDVRVDYTPSLVPFGPSDAHVSYTVRNTGNVTVLGEPRVRITGPFGTTLATKKAQATREVLPGQSFTVRTALGGVAPALVDTAVVDVSMAAAPGPDTQIPLVSSTARSTFVAVPWTGLLLVVLLAGAGWWAWRRRQARRQEGEAMWAELVDQARSGRLPAGSASAGAAELGVLLVGAVLVAGVLAVAGAASPARAADPAPSAAATLTLAVPAQPSAGATTTTSTTQQTTTSSGTTRRTTTAITSGGAAPAPSVESQVLADDNPTAGASTPSPAPSPRVLAADTVWRTPSGFTPAQWGLIALTTAVLVGAAGFGIRALLAARAARAAG